MVIVQQTTDSRVHLVSQFLPNVWAVYIFFSHNNAVKFGEFLTVFSDWNHEKILVFPVLCPVLCLSAGFIEGQVSGHIKAFSAVSRLEKGIFLKGYPLHGFPGGGVRQSAYHHEVVSPYFRCASGQNIFFTPELSQSVSFAPHCPNPWEDGPYLFF